MYIPQNFFDKFHTERLTKEGKRTIFTEYYERQKQMTMLDKIKEAFAAIWPPTHEEVECDIYFRLPSGIDGNRVIKVRMPYRQWMYGDTLINALTEELDRQLRGMFLKGKPVVDFKNRTGIHEIYLLGNPRTGKRTWNNFK